MSSSGDVVSSATMNPNGSVIFDRVKHPVVVGVTVYNAETGENLGSSGFGAYPFHEGETFVVPPSSLTFDE